MGWFSSKAELLREIAEREDGHPHPERVSGYKVLGEIGLMLMVCGRSGKLSHSKDYQEILSAFSLAVGKISLPTADPTSNLRFLLGVTLALEANGVSSDRFRETATCILRQDLLRVLDQTPWSIVSLTYFLDRCNIRHSCSSVQDLYNCSILHSRPPLHLLSTHELYALSHLLFFFGDFGWNRSFFTQLPENRSLSRYIDHVTAACLIDEDWDLTGEFLIGYECIGGVDRSPICDFAWRQFLRHQLPEGQIDLPRRIRKSGDHAGVDPLETFERHYHQTLVGMIASTLYQQRDG